MALRIISLPVERLLRKVSDPLLTVDAMTIGVFDGLHLGHKTLIDTMLSLKSGGQTALVTFSEHPRRILNGHPPVRLLDFKIRNRILSEWGVDWLVVLEATPELFQLEAGEFLDSILDAIRTNHFVVGPNFQFGKDRKGTIETLRKKIDDRLVVLDEKIVGAHPPRATLIRKLLAEADLAGANALLGRPYSVIGQVRSGDGIGRAMGSPTLNIEPVPAAMPDGVYAVRTSAGNGVAHIGPRPTFEKAERRFEVHLFENRGNTDEMEVEFIQRIRDIRKFDHPDALRAAISSDIESAQRALS